MEQASEGSLTRPKKAVPTGCGDEEEEESIVDTVMKFIPAPLMDMFNKKWKSFSEIWFLQPSSNQCCTALPNPAVTPFSTSLPPFQANF